jgi:alkylation response protein AidB-like acyl-CoA dehydrogenase
MAVEYSKVREQFGRPIAGFQALRHLLATMAGRAAALRSLVQASLTDADADPMRRRELGLVAKAFSARVGRYVAEEALQVHGGIGFTAEYRLHPYFRRILTLQGSFGEPERALEEIGATLLGLAHTNQPEVR